MPYDLLSGLRVIEMAEFVFVPAAGALLADLGADVIKVEHPSRGDRYRNTSTASLGPWSAESIVNANRGKRSIGINLKEEAGREVLLQLVEESDALITNFRQSALDRLGLTLEVLRERNPNLVFARGGAYGPLGPERDRAGYDETAFWCRGSFAYRVTDPDARYPSDLPASVGDRTASMGLAFGLVAALLKRERTQVAPSVDVSLIGTAAWVLGADLLAGRKGLAPRTGRSRAERNPLVNRFKSRDGRFLSVLLMEPDRYWAEFCRLTGCEHLRDDPRFSDYKVRAEHAQELLDELDPIFAAEDFDVWVKRFAAADFPWDPVQSAKELAADPQVTANHYLTELVDADDAYVVAGPAQFDGDPPALRRAPELGENTEEILLDMGLDWEAIIGLKETGVVS